MSVYLTAWQDAGHLVVASRPGLEIALATIDPAGPHVRLARPLDTFQHRALRQAFLAMALAGPAADAQWWTTRLRAYGLRTVSMIAEAAGWLACDRTLRGRELERLVARVAA